MGTNRSSGATSKRVKTLGALSFCKVLIDSAVPHLNREFDYAFEQSSEKQFPIGSKVKLRFGRQNLSGWIVEKFSNSNYSDRITLLSERVGSIPTLKPSVIDLCRQVADYYGGTFSDVVRFAVPPRAAKSEKLERLITKYSKKNLTIKDLGITGEKEFTERLGSYFQAGILLQPHDDWRKLALGLIENLLDKKLQSIVLVPDYVNVTDLYAFVTDHLDSSLITTLTSELSTKDRYDNFLKIYFNEVEIVIGNRNSIFAPVDNLGALIVLNEFSDLYESPQAPYWQVRTVAQMRAKQLGCSLIFVGYGFSTHLYDQIQSRKIVLLKSNNQKKILSKVLADRNGINYRKSEIAATAYQAIARSNKGPVLVQVPRKGMASLLQCEKCLRVASCESCFGALKKASDSELLHCARCGRIEGNFRCAYCQNPKTKISIPGHGGILKLLGKYFPNRKIISSTGANRVSLVLDEPAIVVCTPGAEPKAQNGYESIVVLNAESNFFKPNLEIIQETYNQWAFLYHELKNEIDVMFVLSGDLDSDFMQDFSEHDVLRFLARDLTNRKSVGLPPDYECVSILGDLSSITTIAEQVKTAMDVKILGPVKKWDDAENHQIALLSKDIYSLVKATTQAAWKKSQSPKLSVNIKVNSQEFI